MYVLWRHFGITHHQAEHEIPAYVLDALVAQFMEYETGGE